MTTTADPLFYEGVGMPAFKAYRLGKTLLTIASGESLACASASFSYNRTMEYMYPLNLDQVIMVAGMPEGTLTLAVLVGPSEGIASFISGYSSVCNPSNKSISLTPSNACTGSGNDHKTTFTFKGLSISGINGQVSRTQGGNIVVPQIAMRFTQLSVD